MVTLRIITALVLFASCGKGKAESPEVKAQEQVLKAQGTAALPAETRVVIGISVPKIAASPLARRMAADLLGRDADAEQRLRDLLAHCRIDPEKDIDSITIGMAQGEDLALLVRGRIDEKSLTACVKDEANGSGGQFADKSIAGHTVYTVTSREGGQKVLFTFDPDHTVIAALSEAWLTKIIDPKAPKLDSAKETAPLFGRAAGEKDAAAWGAGFLPPGVGENLVKLTEGQVTQPAQSVSFEATFDKGLVATLRLDMKGATDAEKVAVFAKGQIDWLAIAAQRYSVGPLVAKIQIVSEQASVKFSLRLDDADVKTLEAALAKGAPAPPKKPEEKSEKKELPK